MTRARLAWRSMRSDADVVPSADATGTRAPDPASAGVLVGVAMLALAGSIALAWDGHTQPVLILHRYLRIDATARLFLLLVNLVFVGVAVYVWGRVRAVPALRVGITRMVLLMGAFVTVSCLSILSNHYLVGWLLLEISTFCAAPMIIRHNQPATLAASWRYFLFSSVGLALTLLGFACILRGFEVAGVPGTLFLDQIDPGAGAGPWQRIGVALTLLGYGTKLGLAPMHTWLPETYDEAPPAVTALLGAVQFNCALVGLFRVLEVFRDTNAQLVTTQLIAVGLISMTVSAVSIVVTRNYKRLIAYASINHAGVIAIGLGIGKGAMYGLVLYVVSNAFIKAILFLTAGKIKARYRTKDMGMISGLIRDMPQSGLFLMIGTFALLGLPPFGSFLGELLILSELIRAGQPLVFGIFCVLLTISFVATGRSLFPMIWGPSNATGEWSRPSRALGLSLSMLFAALLAMGLYLPAPISDLFRAVALSLGGT